MERIALGAESSPAEQAVIIDGVPADSTSSEVAFRLLYEAEFDQQVRRAALIVDSVEVAHDVVQTAFAAVWQRWNSLDQPGAYLNRCVSNGCADHYRHRTRTARLLRRLQAPETVINEPDPLFDVLSQLPFNQRSAIVLRFFGGLGDTEIAAAMDCPVGSVGPWITRALRRLRKELQ